MHGTGAGMGTPLPPLDGTPPATADAGRRATPVADGEALVRRSFRSFEGVLGGGDLARAAGLFADDYVAHDPSLPPLSPGPGGGSLPARASRTAFPDQRVMVDDLLAAGGRVAARLTHRGTHLGPLLDLPPTGRRVQAPGVAIDRVAGGRIAEGWVGFDLPGLLAQLGVPARLGGALPEHRAERTDLRALDDAPPA